MLDDFSVEIGQFRTIDDKGALKGFFSLIIHPEGQKILDCRYFESGEKRWFAFPHKEIKHKNGQKTEYIPYICYVNKVFREQLVAKVMSNLKEVIEKMLDEEKQDNKSEKGKGDKNLVQDDACDLPF